MGQQVMALNFKRGIAEAEKVFKITFDYFFIRNTYKKDTKR